jgi:NTP pyrophosphatase (non-canonical NTP hydrolase)
VTYLDDLAKEIHKTAVEKGFWDTEVNIDFIGAKLALVHSEVSEVLEAIRKQKGSDAIVEEMADTIIRLLDLYAGMSQRGWLDFLPGTGIPVSLDQALDGKTAVNKERPRMHGNLI